MTSTVTEGPATLAAAERFAEAADTGAAAAPIVDITLELNRKQPP
ncbi:hypothetical protein [Nocardia xishanensis]|uniref:Uncharacterized protein n=1 Tax=Nocardia xishanensis TaxID=238964 RepID=A0ABW7X505_9NOCA